MMSERIDKLVGMLLIEIRKKDDSITLYFLDKSTNFRYKLFFEGFLFETASPAINLKVKSLDYRKAIGFKAINILNHHNLKTDDYIELLISMHGPVIEYKIELICVSQKYSVRKI